MDVSIQDHKKHLEDKYTREIERDKLYEVRISVILNATLIRRLDQIDATPTHTFIIREGNMISSIEFMAGSLISIRSAGIFIYFCSMIFGVSRVLAPIFLHSFQRSPRSIAAHLLSNLK